MKGRKPVLEARSLTLIRGGNRLVNDVSLKLHSGELIGVIGPNGAGKSTLLTLLAGLVKPDKGDVWLNGRALGSFRDQERARQIGWLEQVHSVHWPVSVERLVALGRLPHLGTWQSPGAADQITIERALSSTDCLGFRHRAVTTLSGGERTRALLARVLAGEPEVLLADEPIAALDPGHQLQTMDCLDSFVAANRACIVVLHELSLAARYCNRLYLMNRGGIVAEGPPREVLSAENLSAVYGIEAITGNGDLPFIVPLRQIDTGRASAEAGTKR